MRLEPAPETWGRRADLARQVALVTGAALMYFLVRGLTQGGVERAQANAEHLLRIEDRLGIDIEAWAQGLVLDHGPLVTLSNWVYIWGHWPVIIATLYGLHRWRPAEFRLLRNALFVSGAIGLMIYVSLPVAPPRLLDAGYHDTVTELSSSYRVLQPPALVNKYAAMPSLHAGWNLLAGVALFRASRHVVLRAMAVAGPIAMAVAVVTTANHYVLDVIVGESVAVVGWIVAWHWLRPPELRDGDVDGRLHVVADGAEGGTRASPSVGTGGRTGDGDSADRDSADCDARSSAQRADAAAGPCLPPG